MGYLAGANGEAVRHRLHCNTLVVKAETMWAQLINALLGVWLTAAPAVLGYIGPARTNDRILGPLAAGAALIAIWETTRPVRWINALLGLWLPLAPWMLGYRGIAFGNSTMVGVLLLVCASVRGERRQRDGGGWASLLEG